MRLAISFLAFFLFASLECEAAYRLYQLKVSYMVPGEKEARVVMVETSLDPKQWASYNNDYLGAKVELLDHWFCPGDTSHHKPCAKPKVSDRTPAMTYPERDRMMNQ